MITNNPYVQTGLLTGKAWDTTCHWIENYIKDLNDKSSLVDSRYYGNYSNSLSPADVTGYGTKQVAGFSDKWCVKNIYDLAGNVQELTAEAYSGHRIGRGGACTQDGSGWPISYRYHWGRYDTRDSLGFRSRLYIK